MTTPLTTPFTVAETPSSSLALPYVPMGAGQQVPPLSKFSGADIDGESESFEEWVEQLELIADMYAWDPRAWLVNLTGSSLQLLSDLFTSATRTL